MLKDVTQIIKKHCLCKMPVEMDLQVDYSSLTVVKDGQQS